MRLGDPSIREEMMTRSGLSYRQLDYWTTRGYLRADEASPGSGNRRTWSQSEVDVAVELKRLTDAGFALAAAAVLARRVVTDQETSIELCPGVYVDVERVS